ncbi:hypothetical protein ACFSHS_16290 [Blastococcus deserti]|uniref:Uncharacterized protein n=1 Tax=Blastococcus deserti TaxID=2259033 RepID=A0ABW4XEQ8_9ACTN
MQQVIDSVSGAAVRMGSPRATELADLVSADGAVATSPEPGVLDLHGIDTDAVGCSPRRRSC